MPARALHCCLLILVAVLAWPEAPAWAQKKPVSGIVQVAVHYGPQRHALLSGVVVGDGQAVLTETEPLKGAAEITIAFTDGELFEGQVHGAGPAGQVGALVSLVRLPQPYGRIVEPSPADAALMGETEAFAGGAPQSFEAVQVLVRLRPVRGPQRQPRWQVTPALPAFHRGGPLLDAQGRLLGLLVQEKPGEALIGVPLAAFADLLTSPQPPAPILQQPPAPIPQQPPAPIPQPPVPTLQPPDLPLPVPSLGWLWKEPAGPPPSVATPPPATPKAEPAPAEEPVSPASTSQPATNASGPVVPAAPTPMADDEVIKRITWANQQSQHGNYSGAVATLEEAIRAHPARPLLHYHLAFAYWSKALHHPDGRRRSTMERSTYRKAIKEFETFLLQAPQDPQAPDARLRLELLRSAQFGYRARK